MMKKASMVPMEAKKGGHRKGIRLEVSRIIDPENTVSEEDDEDGDQH